jgi:glycine/D-amino acid oxidase-like deaminating enzyme
MKIDYLIVGQGLAGTLLAWDLIQRGCSVVIVDNGEENASKIAAGLINPITGMRFEKSDNADTLLPAARRLYAELSGFFQQPFFIEKPMLRIFKNESETNAATRRLKNEDYQAYIDKIQTDDRLPGNLNAPFGFLEQKQTGYLLTRPLLECMKQFFISRNSYRQSDVDYRDFELIPTLRWQYIYPKQIIFCEGFGATRNPWFSWLPFQPVKGELLTLHHQSELPDKIVNFGNWLIPLNTREIRVGATFDRENLNTETTEEGKNEIINSLIHLSPELAHSTVINHEANIRPCTMDRHPFIGRHPKYEQLAIFNGFGAKGSLQIPWYSQRLADNLIGDDPLPDSCNIQRHVKSHFLEK